METITSRDNAKIKYACAVRDTEKQRAADGVFFAEGPKLCLELAKSCTPRVVYATAAALAKTPELARFDPAEIAPHVAEKLSGTKSNQGVFALFETPVPPADILNTARRILALEGVQDPGNVGTLLRSAAAFGFADAAHRGFTRGAAKAACPGRHDAGNGAVPFPPAGRGRKRLPGRAVRRHRQRGPGPDGCHRRSLRHGRAHPDDRPCREFERRRGGQRAVVAFQGRVSRHPETAARRPRG